MNASDTEVIVRSTVEDDWAALKAVRLAALLDAPTAFGVSHADAAAESDEAWRTRAAGRGRAHFILAFQEKIAVGIVACIPENAADCGLIAMWVHPALRGGATAGALVDAAKSRAASLGHARIVLDVAPDNGRAVAFYQRHGFVFLPEWEALASHPQIRVQKMACLLSIDASAISIG